MTDVQPEPPRPGPWVTPPTAQPPAGGGFPPPPAAGYQPYQQPGFPGPGHPPAGYPPVGPYARPPMTPADERTWAMLAHLAPFAGLVVGIPVLGALVVYLMYKDRSPFVRRHAAAALNFQLMVLIVGLVGGVLAFLLVIVTLGLGLLLLIPFVLVLLVAPLVLQILGAVAANRGQEFTYPLTPTMVR